MRLPPSWSTLTHRFAAAAIPADSAEKTPRSSWRGGAADVPTAQRLIEQSHRINSTAPSIAALLRTLPIHSGRQVNLPHLAPILPIKKHSTPWLRANAQAAYTLQYAARRCERLRIPATTNRVFRQRCILPLFSRLSYDWRSPDVVFTWHAPALFSPLLKVGEVQLPWNGNFLNLQ